MKLLGRLGLTRKTCPVIKKTKTEICKNYLVQYFCLTIGSIIVAFALQSFLLPHKIFDGGIIGVSMMLSYLTKTPLGLLIFILNLPFMAFAYHKLGLKFVIQTLYAVSILAISTNFIGWEIATNDSFLAPIFGGIILGTGVGIILKNNASLDGTEIMSIKLSKKFSFMTVGEFLMGFNIFIYLAAGIMFGWDKAMYSIITYFIASKTIDIVIEGLNSSKAVRIVSTKYREIGDTIMQELNVSVTYIRGKGGYSGNDNVITFCVVSRIEMAKLKELVNSIDPKAFLVIENVHEVEGIRIKKK